VAVHISRDLSWSLEVARRRGHQQGRIAENLRVFLVLVALALSEVSAVAPLAGTAPLFVLPFTPLFLKGVKGLTGRIIGGAILIALGVFLLTVKG
jgi:uncharacterized membrane protein